MKSVIKLVLFIFSAALLFIMGIYLLQEKIIFQPTPLPQDHQYVLDVPFTEFFIESNDGARLNGLHLKVEDPKGMIVYYHGNAGDLQRWGEICSFFLQFHYDVLVMDYRTYGKSTGKLTEKNLYSDAQLFYDKAKEDFSEENIVIYGRSLGASIATKIASENEPSQLILETPFYSLTDLVKDKFKILPVSKLLKYRFPSSTFIKSVSCPVTILHGTADGVVPYESGLKLFNSISNKPRTLVTIEGGGHNDLINFDTYSTAIQNALQ
ncbi:alpha/beta hydrolase [Constantimarinum furrinae]|uniref:Hydrolase n=1 Tax=Constantimarinum furrinae TaxID=2562285 RepID=A0A7G8PWE0_9FLAO|nr:alpha/beta hydrolase [Constantimarinum furrinae]QNJ98656.1 hydrolase [Constantimarinum furrinae]